MAEKKADDQERKAVPWNPPDTRQMPVFIHNIVCEWCGRSFTAETYTSVPPKFCLKADNPDCYQERKAAYMRDYRRKKSLTHQG